MQEDTNCSICSENYNISTKLPRILNCQHTFCSLCLKNLKNHRGDHMNSENENFQRGDHMNSKNENFQRGDYMNYIKCPKDGIKTIMEKNQIEQLPLNFEILEEIRKKKKGIFCEKKKCETHLKKLELICLSDNKQICVDCVLFGIHKNCDYDKKKNYLEFVKNKVKYLEKIFLEISENEIFSGFLKMEEKKDFFLGKIETIFKKIEDFFILKKKEVKKNLGEFFDNLEIFHSEIFTKRKKIEKEKDLWILNFNELKKEIDVKNPNFGFLLKNLKPNSEFENSFKKIDEEKKKLKNLENLFLNQKINNFDVNFNFDNFKTNFSKNLKISQKTENFENFPKVEKKEKFLNLKSLSDLSEEKNSQNSFILENNENSFILANNSNFKKKAKSRRNSFLKKNSSKKKIKNINFDLDKELTTFLCKNKSSINLQNHNNKKDFLKYNKSFLIKNKKNHNNSNFSENSENSENLKIPSYFNKKRLTIGNRNLSTIFLNKKKSLKNKNQNFPKNHNFYKKSKNDSNLNLNHFKTPEITKEKKYRTFYKKSKNTTKKNLSKKKIMNFKNLGINDFTIEKIIEKVNLNDYIKILDLSNNQISIFGFEKILDNFFNHKNLEQIILSNNFLDNSVLQKINNKSKKLKKLKSFVLKKNKLFQNRGQLIRNINILSNKGFDIQI